MHMRHPFKYVVKFVRLLKKNQSVGEKAWDIAMNSHKTTLVLQYPPHIIAAGSVYLACTLLEKELPSFRGRTLGQDTFFCQPANILDFCHQMLDFYIKTSVTDDDLDLASRTKRLLIQKESDGEFASGDFASDVSTAAFPASASASPASPLLSISSPSSPAESRQQRQYQYHQQRRRHLRSLPPPLPPLSHTPSALPADILDDDGDDDTGENNDEDFQDAELSLLVSYTTTTSRSGDHHRYIIKQSQHRQRSQPSSQTSLHQRNHINFRYLFSNSTSPQRKSTSSSSSSHFH